MRATALLILTALAAAAFGTAAESTTIKAYVDTSVCSHLLLGTISTQRMDCSKKAFKEWDEPVLVALENNQVFSVNKPKMVK
nr:hypothetical protein [Bryobacter sp.]